jgi:hypothetical protein
MTTAICGHDRVMLRCVLESANGSNLNGISRDWPRPEGPTGAAPLDVSVGSFVGTGSRCCLSRTVQSVRAYKRQ